MREPGVAYNHIGLCVSDVARSRQFYEQVLEFAFWWEMDAPDEPTAVLLQLDKPVGLHAAYLVRDGLILELLCYHPDRQVPARTRSMAEPGLTHLSFSVRDVDETLRRVEQHGGSIVEPSRSAAAVMIRDPDGQLIELLGFGWRDRLPPLPA